MQKILNVVVPKYDASRDRVILNGNACPPYCAARKDRMGVQKRLHPSLTHHLDTGEYQGITHHALSRRAACGMPEMGYLGTRFA
jgi:hypothetical protein